MRRRFIFCECERCNGSGVPPRSAWVKLAGPLPANVSLLGASGLRPAPLFVGPWGPATCRLAWPFAWNCRSCSGVDLAQRRPADFERDHARAEGWLRWVDGPKAYGRHKTIYNRFAGWSERGIWQKIFEAVAAPSEPPKQAGLDSRHVKVHRCASGGKGGPNFRRSGSPRAAAIAKSTRSSMSFSARGY